MNENYTDRDNDELGGRNLCVVRMDACFNECYLLFCYLKKILLPIIIWKKEIKFQYGLKYFVCHRLAMI